MKTLTRAAGLTAAAALLLGTAATGTAHAYLVPKNEQQRQDIHDDPALLKSQATFPHNPSRALHLVSPNTCRVIIDPIYLPNRDPLITTSFDRVALDDSGVVNVPVPPQFRNVKGVRVEVQVVFPATPHYTVVIDERGFENLRITHYTPRVPAWAARTARAWEGTTRTTQHRHLTVTHRPALPLGATFPVTFPTGANWFDDYEYATLYDINFKVTFATGTARRIPVTEPYSGNPNRPTTGKCRGIGKTFGNTEHHHLTSLVIGRYLEFPDLWVTPNNLTRLKVG